MTLNITQVISDDYKETSVLSRSQNLLKTVFIIPEDV